MKKIILPIIGVFLCLIFPAQASADLNDGLEAYYPFNGNADDVTGNGYGGTVFGDTALTEDSLAFICYALNRMERKWGRIYLRK